jgi:transposase
MRGKKGAKHSDPLDPPRRRANQQRGHGTYANDRPPIVGTLGRVSGQVRLRLVPQTNSPTLAQHVAQFTRPEAVVNTDEWRGYAQMARAHVTIHHGVHEWARDEDHDGRREVHINTIEGLWVGVRNFLRPFRGVRKDRLAGYIAMCEHRINLKCITPAFIAAFVRDH